MIPKRHIPSLEHLTFQDVSLGEMREIRLSLQGVDDFSEANVSTRTSSA